MSITHRKHRVPANIIDTYYQLKDYEQVVFNITHIRQPDIYIQASIRINEHLEPDIEYSIERIQPDEPPYTHTRGRETNKFRIPDYLLDLNEQQQKFYEHRRDLTGEPVNPSYFEATSNIQSPDELPDLLFDLVTITERTR